MLAICSTQDLTIPMSKNTEFSRKAKLDLFRSMQQYIPSKPYPLKFTRKERKSRGKTHMRIALQKECGCRAPPRSAATGRQTKNNLASGFGEADFCFCYHIKIFSSLFSIHRRQTALISTAKIWREASPQQRLCPTCIRSNRYQPWPHDAP